MKRHELDLSSLVFGVILAISAVLHGLHRWWGVRLDAGVAVPVTLIGLGVLTLAATFLRGRQE